MRQSIIHLRWMNKLFDFVLIVILIADGFTIYAIIMDSLMPNPEYVDKLSYFSFGHILISYRFMK